jgi:uncharacterized protein (TIGR02452 family)
MSHHRSEAARQGREAAAIAEAGFYVSPSGRRVEIAERVAHAVSQTRDYAPDAGVTARSPGSRSGSSAPRHPRDETPDALASLGVRRSQTRVSVINGSSLASARAIAARGVVPMVLNFASAKKPGGGFLSGARAQEESLARSSALAACLAESAMYAHHRARSAAMYTSWMIHSPAVPVFRDDATGALLEEPYDVTFLTAPAPNAKVVLERDRSRAAEVTRIMRERVTRVLAIAAAHGETHLVLGAWGCGVFGNDPSVVADAFATELGGAFAGVFEEVVFAVLDWSAIHRFITPFEQRFAS